MGLQSVPAQNWKMDSSSSHRWAAARSTGNGYTAYIYTAKATGSEICIH